MRTYTITGPDGKDYSIDGPEGATREQVISKIKERLSAKSQAVSDPYTAQAQKQTIGQNLLAGVGGGMTSLYLGAKQMLGKATPEEIADHKKAMAGLRSTTAGTIGDIGGQVIAAAPAALIPGANTYIGATLTGAGLGALQPTGENDSRTENMILGAAGGAAGKYVGDAVGKLATSLKAKLTSVDDIVSKLSSDLNSKGIDYSKLSKQTQESLLKDAKTALRSGGALDADALARKADFESIGIKPTLGQVTRDPMQYQFEQNTRGVVGSGESLSQRFNEQNSGLIDAVNKARMNISGGQGADKYDAGQALVNSLSAKDSAAKANVGSLYDTARNAAGIDTRLNNGRFAQTLNDALDQQMLGDALPGDVRKAINQIATGEMPFTIQKAEQIRQAINGQMPKIPDRSGVAMRMVNDALQNEIDSVGSGVGGQAAEAFKAARGAAAQRFSELEKSPALKAAVDGFEPNDFVDKFVIKAKPGDLMSLRANVQDNPELWNEARGQVIDFLKNKAVSNQSDEFAKFSQSGFNNGLKSIGDARLKILFNPDEIAELKKIQRVAASIQVQPVGSAVNNSGTSQAVTNLLTRLSNVPYLKELAVNPILNFRMQGNIDSALNAAIPSASKQATKGAAIDPNLLQRLLPLYGAQVGASANQQR
jgi:hypothetical protein